MSFEVISTIIDFGLLTEYLQDTPIQYGGGIKNVLYGHGDGHYASGTSIIFSQYVVKEFITKKQYIRTDLIDDVSIGVLIRDHLPNITQQYIESRFVFIPDENGERSKILDVITDKSYIFYRNRNPERKTDVKQMEIIIDYLQNTFPTTMNSAQKELIKQALG